MDIATIIGWVAGVAIVMQATSCTIISEEIGLVRCGPEQVLAAQVRILAQVYELVEQGTIEL